MFTSIGEFLFEPRSWWSSRIGFHTKFDEFDELFGGFRDGELTLIMGKEGNGSSEFTDYLAVKLANTGDILYLFHGTSEYWISERLSQNTGIRIYEDNKIVIDRNLSFYISRDIYFVDEIEKIILQFRREHPSSIIFIESLQALYLSDEILKIDRQKELNMILFDLKKIAIKLGVSIVVHSEIPYIADKESLPLGLGDLDCFSEAWTSIDNIIFTYRPECYGISQDINKESTGNKITIDIPYMRNAGSGTLKMGYNAKKRIVFELP